jgi:2Fe-2S ferredoxin
MLELKNAQVKKIITPEIGWTVLDLALKHEVQWGFSCTRGTCARCRCLVTNGQEYLEEPTEAEINRLEPDELAQGYRLACQCEIQKAGDIQVTHKPYF